MPSLIVDESKCRRDGICVGECPIRLIELRDDSPAPTWVDGAEAMCVECGHCVTACPQGAISLSTMPVQLCRPVRRDLLRSVGPAEIEHHLRVRRSVRRFENSPVSREVLSRLIDTARYAPSGSNSQPVQWLVVYEAEDVRRLAGHAVDWIRSLVPSPSPRYTRAVALWDAGEDTMIAGNAPHLVFALAPKPSRWSHVNLSLVACTIALTYFECAASAHGLGTCWGGILTLAANDWPPMREALGLADDQGSYGAMMVGYPVNGHRRVPLRRPARVTWL